MQRDGVCRIDPSLPQSAPFCMLMNILTLDILRAACSHRVSVANLMWHWPGGSGLRYDTGQECLTPHSLWEWETVRLCLAPLLLHVMKSLWYHFPRWLSWFCRTFWSGTQAKTRRGAQICGSVLVAWTWGVRSEGGPISFNKTKPSALYGNC